MRGGGHKSSLCFSTISVIHKLRHAVVDTLFLCITDMSCNRAQNQTRTQKGSVLFSAMLASIKQAFNKINQIISFL